MKKLQTARSGLLVFVFTLLYSTLSAQNNNSLGPPSFTLMDGSNFVAGHTSLAIEPELLQIVVPSVAQVKQVLLYWHLFNENLAPSTIKLRPGGSESSFITISGDNIGSDTAVPFAPAANSAVIQADITELNLVSPGTNLLTVFTEDVNVSGAGLIVIYDEHSGSGGLRLLNGHEGIVKTGTSSSSWGETLSFEVPSAPYARDANLNLFVGGIISQNLVNNELRLLAQISNNEGPIGDSPFNITINLSEQTSWHTIRIPFYLPSTYNPAVTDQISVSFQVLPGTIASDTQTISLVRIAAALNVKNEKPICDIFMEDYWYSYGFYFCDETRPHTMYFSSDRYVYYDIYPFNLNYNWSASCGELIFNDQGSAFFSFSLPAQSPPASCLINLNISDGINSSSCSLNIGEIPCPFDCFGDFGGMAVVDHCGVCDGDNSSCADCFSTPNGPARLDGCGVCGGNNSSCADCLGIPNGSAKLDACGICNGNNSCIEMRCPILNFRKEITQTKSILEIQLNLLKQLRSQLAETSCGSDLKRRQSLNSSYNFLRTAAKRHKRTIASLPLEGRTCSISATCTKLSSSSRSQRVAQLSKQINRLSRELIRRRENCLTATSNCNPTNTACTSLLSLERREATAQRALAGSFQKNVKKNVGSLPSSLFNCH